MNVLHVISSMNPLTGGTCQGIINLHDELNRLGMRQEIVSLDNADATYIQDSNLVIHALGNPSSSWQYNTHLYPWLKLNLDRFDVIVLHGLWLYLGFAVRRTLSELIRNYKRANQQKAVPKFFIFPHGMLDPWFQQDARRRVKAIRNAIYWYLLEHRIINSADGLLFTCETELLRAKEPFPFYAPKREINIGFGVVQPPPYSETIRDAFYNRFPHLINETYFLFLGRIHFKKGVDLLIQAYEELILETVPVSLSIPKLVIAGPGLESSYGQAILRRVAESSVLHNTVTFTGMIVDEIKWGSLYNAEAFVLPSYQENFGIAVAEALACQKAVLISNQVNIWREIDASRAGIVFDNTVASLKQALQTFLTLDQVDKRLMSQQAYNTYATTFSVDPVAQRFVDAITS